LRARRVRYWGDIDTHGFSILDQLRVHLPQASPAHRAPAFSMSNRVDTRNSRAACRSSARASWAVTGEPSDGGSTDAW